MPSYQCNFASYRESQDRPSLPCRWSSLQIKVFSIFCVWEFRIPCCGAFCVTLAISLSEGRELGSPCFPLYSPRLCRSWLFRSWRVEIAYWRGIYPSRGSLTSSKKVGWALRYAVSSLVSWYTWADCSWQTRLIQPRVGENKEGRSYTFAENHLNKKSKENVRSV